MLLRNIAIIAHVDHGKTTLVDKLLQQSGTLDARMTNVNCVMDSNDLEKERGITILAKNTALKWRDYRINIVDTPGHADFGGEVERILSMVDAVLLLVDAVDGPMPQTRFVTQKAFARGLCPIVVINKIDRPGSRPSWVIDQVFDLFDRLGATEEQLDFPVVYTSALLGTATNDLNVPGEDMTAVFEAITKYVPVPQCDKNGPFQMQISSLDYSSYVGTIGIGLIKRGTISSNTQVSIIDTKGKIRQGRVLQILGYLGLERIEQPQAEAGDIVAITGIEPLAISDTLCDKTCVEALTPLTVDEPTISMTFQVNTSPLSGEGQFVTSRQIRERLARECLHNVALRVEDTEDPDKFKVSGRGELHLSILIETMRREGYEIAVSRPEVILHKEGETILEPYEILTIDVEEKDQGAIMEQLGARRGQLNDMVSDGKGRIRLDYSIPARSLIGFHSLFLTLTSGTGIMTHVFDKYGPYKTGGMGGKRGQGVLISNAAGKATAYSLWGLQARGKLFIDPQTEVYEGMVIGIHTRDNDLVVNVIKGKQLTNIRASGSDENIMLTPPIKLSLEQSLEFIEDDELVEITPLAIRLRKKYLKEHERKKASRSGE